MLNLFLFKHWCCDDTGWSSGSSSILSTPDVYTFHFQCYSNRVTEEKTGIVNKRFRNTLRVCVTTAQSPKSFFGDNACLFSIVDQNVRTLALETIVVNWFVVLCNCHIRGDEILMRICKHIKAKCFEGILLMDIKNRI